MELVPRFFKAPAGSFYLFGPRGTGKSLWTKTHFQNALHIDLLQPETFRSFAAHPERLKDVLHGNPGKKEVVIDEVQKVPDLLTVVHGLIEEKRGTQFVLTGSSARKLKRSGIDLMAGRAVVRSLHPYMAAELGARFSLETALQQGLVPLVFGAEDPADILRSYAALYLREEVQMEGLVRNVSGFSRFLEAISFSQSCPLNITNVARDCQVERKTVESYVEILEDLLLSFRVPVFTKRAKRALAAHPKFFFFDAGVFRSLRAAGPLDQPGEIEGQALEGLVAQHLCAWIAYTSERHELFYWRTRSGVEVDFIVYGEKGLWAIEVKNNARVRGEDLRGLKSFLEDYPQSHCALLYRGKERLKIDGILCLPCEEALLEIHPNKSIF